ncbi:MAG: RHS repeat domain-containing protein [Blastocatellales bacterium]
MTDHLGSTRMEADLSGSLAGMRRHDYLPFGEELTSAHGAQRSGVGYEPPASNVRQKFTGKERDGETGLDYFLARYYSSIQGRFTSKDPVLMSRNRTIDPQQINLYVYGRNNPLTYIDPDGEEIKYSHGNPDKKLSKEQEDSLKEAVKTLREQSGSANNAFSVYDGKSGQAPDLDIQLLDDKTFDQLPDISSNTQGYATTGTVFYNEENKPISVSVIIMLRESAVSFEKEIKDRKAQKETKVEGIISHELGHAKEISTDLRGYQERRAADKNASIPYRDRAAERFANRESHLIVRERVANKHLKQTQTNLRW